MANKLMKIIPALVFAAFALVISGEEIKMLRNLHCSPRPAVVETRPGFYPYFVSLHRCNGSKGIESPALFKCVPKKTKDVTLTVQFGPVKRILTMKNHTECTSECTLTREKDCPYPGIFDPIGCNCRCLHSSPPSDVKQCGPLKSWSQLKCGCSCDKTDRCPKKYVFDPATCGCKCNPKRKLKCEDMRGVFDAEKCKCRNMQRQIADSKDKDSFIGSTTFWIYILIGEFVFLLFCFDVVLCFKKMGLIYRLTKSCRGDKTYEVEEERNEPKSPGEVKVHYNEGCQSAFSSLHDIPTSSQFQQGGIRQF